MRLLTSYIFVYPIPWRFPKRVPLHGFRTVLCHGNLCNLTNANAYRKCLSQMLIANAYRLLQLCNTSQRISAEIRRGKTTDRTIVRQLHITSKNQFNNFFLLFDHLYQRFCSKYCNLSIQTTMQWVVHINYSITCCICLKEYRKFPKYKEIIKFIHLFTLLL